MSSGKLKGLINLYTEPYVAFQDAEEYADCEAAVKSHTPFIEAMRKRGIEDMDLVMVDPW